MTGESRGIEFIGSSATNEQENRFLRRKEVEKSTVSLSELYFCSVAQVVSILLNSSGCHLTPPYHEIDQYVSKRGIIRISII